MNATAREEAWDSTLTSGGEAVSLVESAMLLRWRAPELALVLADRAVRAAGEHRPTVLRAEHLAVVALNRLGRHGEAAQRLLPALRDADVPAELRHELQIELAHCAADLGEPATALAALRPVLVAGEDIAPVLRGTALVAAVESLGALGRADDVSAALDEADELFREDAHLDRDTALLLRATAKAVSAVRHRRSGAAMECEAQARAGRELLAGLADPEHDSGQVSGRLMLEIALALLDRGEGDAAEREARPMLRRPVRAAAAGAVGWLRLAIATRVHLAEGRHEPALALLADAVEVTQRHGVDAVLAECLEGLSYVHEVRGEFADALHCLRSARAAEDRHRRTAEAARSALVEHCGVARRELAGLVDQIAALLPATGGLRAGPDPDTGLLDAEEYACRVEAALPGSAPLSQVLIAVGSAADEPPDRGLLVEVSERLRAAVPEGSALGQITGDRIAVLLPATRGTDARAWADRFRAGLAAELGADLTVGVAQRRAGHGVDQFLADTVLALRTVAKGRQPAAQGGAVEPGPPIPAKNRSTGEVASQEEASPEMASPQVAHPEEAHPEMAHPEMAHPEMAHPEEAHPEEAHPEEAHPEDDRCEEFHPDEPVAQPSPELPAEEEPPTRPEDPSSPGARRRRGTNGTPVLVSDLLPRSVLSSGRSGRRRAEDRAEEPPAAEAAQVGDGETDATGRSVDPAHPKSGAALSLAPVDPVLGPPPAPTLRALDWGSNGSRSKEESAQAGMGDLLAEALAAFQEGRRLGPPSDALTDPELRLPELTAEPLWRPPGTGRQSAAGD